MSKNERQAQTPFRTAISVRDLVAFVWRRGGIGRSVEGRLPNRALRGTQGHQFLQRQRPEGYSAEISLRYECEGRGYQLRVFGRIDGVFTDQSPPVIEEIKTVTRAWDGRPRSLHWAQLRFYAAVYARDHDLSEVGLLLTYLNLDTGQVENFREHAVRSELDHFLQETVSGYTDWLEKYEDWRIVRNASIARLAFPFEDFRTGQDDLIEGVERAISNRQRLFVEAATGLGKTMAIMFPVLKAMAGAAVGRVYYLSAKNTGKEAVLKALNVLRGRGLRLRSLNLKSKESTCIRAGVACDAETCPLAIDYYQNQKAAMDEALKGDDLGYEQLIEVGERFQVCPFALALDLTRFVDVVICDYNYIFEQQSLLRPSVQMVSGRALVLVDECHNLVERGRDMYSAALHSSDLVALRKELGRRHQGLHRAVGRVLSLIDVRGQREPSDRGKEEQQTLLFGDSDSLGSPMVDRPLQFGTVTEGLPMEIASALSRLRDELEQWLAAGTTGAISDALLLVYFEILRLLRLAELERRWFRCYLEGTKEPVLRLFCVDPSVFLRDVMEPFLSVICFSGTLTPVALYRRLLGGDETDPVLTIGSPFPPERLSVSIHSGIDTRLRFRDKSLVALVGTIARVLLERKGRYLVFFSSYDYLLAVAAGLRERFVEGGDLVQGEDPRDFRATGRRCGASGTVSAEGLFRFTVASGPDAECHLECVCQIPGMSEDDRRALIKNIVGSTTETVATFAVLGGHFGEAIDVPENRLTGIIVIGVGYPKVTRERELLKDYFDGESMDGFGTAYLVPGLNRVIQAAGRLVRSEFDRGVLLLVDRRYDEPLYRNLLPAWWQINR